MDHRTRTDLLLMTLELRLAALAPSELVGRRLTPQRLQEIAAALEARLRGHGFETEPGQARPANDVAAAGPSPMKAVRLRGQT